MPTWLAWLLPLALTLVEKYGLPALEQKFPFLIPIVTEIMAVLGGTPPSPSLTSAAGHFNALVSVPPEVKKT